MAGLVDTLLEPRTLDPTALPSLPVEGLKAYFVGVSEVTPRSLEATNILASTGPASILNDTRAFPHEPLLWSSALPFHSF